MTDVVPSIQRTRETVESSGRDSSPSSSIASAPRQKSKISIPRCISYLSNRTNKSTTMFAIQSHGHGPINFLSPYDDGHGDSSQPLKRVRSSSQDCALSQEEANYIFAEFMGQKGSNESGVMWKFTYGNHSTEAPRYRKMTVAEFNLRRRVMEGRYTKDMIRKTYDVPEADRTTVILRNLPDAFTQDDILDALHEFDYGEHFDFIYMPIGDMWTLEVQKCKTRLNMGYCVINFVNPQDAADFKKFFFGYDWNESGIIGAEDDNKKCDVSWSEPYQGLAACIDQYRSSSVMHESVPPECKPCLYRNGEQKPFPGPFTKIEAPNPPRFRQMTLEEHEATLEIMRGNYTEEMIKRMDDMPNEDRTTVMIRNIPKDLSKQRVLDALTRFGVGRQIHFFYLPMDFKTKRSMGYSFVNFSNVEHAREFKANFGGFNVWGVPTEKETGVSWREPYHGLAALINQYRSSPVMHETVSDEYKPCLFMDGERIPFPHSLKPLLPPKVRTQPRVNAEEKRRMQMEEMENKI